MTESHEPIVYSQSLAHKTKHNSDSDKATPQPHQSICNTTSPLSLPKIHTHTHKHTCAPWCFKSPLLLFLELSILIAQSPASSFHLARFHPSIISSVMPSWPPQTDLTVLSWVSFVPFIYFYCSTLSPKYCFSCCLPILYLTRPWASS